jgi:type II secretory pathway pseudopilin PulG
MSLLARRRASAQDGFTLIELIVAMTIGMVILGSATMITIGAARHNTEVASRTDATQRARLATDRMQRLLRSEVCVFSSADNTVKSWPMTLAKPDQVVFYADLSGGTTTYQHTLTYDATAKTLTDKAQQVTATNPIALAPASRTEILATGVNRNTTGANPTGAIFRFYGYPQTTTGILQPNLELVPPTLGLSATDLKRIARVDLDFLAVGNTKLTTNIVSEGTDQIFVRIANPNGISDGSPRNPYDPVCA